MTRQRSSNRGGGGGSDYTGQELWQQQGYSARIGTQNPDFPYYYTREDDPGYIYVPDYDDPRNSPRRYKYEDVFWLVGSRPPEADRDSWGQPKEIKEMSATALDGPVQLVYGIDRIGGSMIDLVAGQWFPPGKSQWVTGLAAGYSVGHGEIEGILKTDYGVEGFSPVSLTGAQGIWQKILTGGAGQVADETMTGLHQARGDGAVGQAYPGIAHVIELVEWLGDDSPLARGFIKPIYTVKGKKLLDPTLGLAGGVPSAPAVWSDQGVIALADYIVNRYGVNAGVNGMEWNSVVDSAGYANERVGTTSVTGVVVNNPEEIVPFVASNLYYGNADGTPPTITFSAPPAGGVQATGTVVADRWPSNPNIWIIRQILVANPGSGYLAAPSITVSTAAYGGRSLSYSIKMGEKRFSFNLAITRQMTHRGVIDMIRSHFRGFVLRRRGKFRILIDKPRASVYLFDPTNSRAKGTARQGFGAPNRVVVQYPDPEQDYKVVDAVEQTAAVDAGTERVVEDVVPLHGIRSVNLAKRIAFYRLYKGLLNLAGSITGTKAIQMKIEPYDRVQSDLSGLDAQDLEVRLIGRSIDNHYEFELGQYDENIFSDTLQVVTPKISTRLPNPLTPPPPPFASATSLWSEPVLRVFDPSKHTAWTSSGYFTGLNATLMTNGDQSSVAVTIPAGTVATSPYLQLDAGAGSTITGDEIYVTIVGVDRPAISPFKTLTSSDGAAWSDEHIPVSWSKVAVDVTNNSSTWLVTASGATARFWRVRLVNEVVGAAVQIVEMSIRDRSTELWPYTSSYRLYDRHGSFFSEVTTIPTVGSMDLTPFTENGIVIFDVEAVSSHGIRGGVFRYQAAQQALPANPTNVNVVEDVTIGPTGAQTSKLKITWTPADVPGSTTRIRVDDGLTVFILGEFIEGPVYLPSPRRNALHQVTLFTVTPTAISTGVTDSVTPIFAGAIVPNVLNTVQVPLKNEDQGVVIFTPPEYDFTAHFEICDTFSGAVDPPVIATIPAAQTQFGVPYKVRLASAIHGDGYSSPRVFSILIKTVSMTGDKSSGVAASWTIQPNGIGTVQVGTDPRDAIFDGTDIWVSNFGSNTVQRIDRYTNVATQTRSVGTKPYGITFNSAVNALYVANYGSNDVTVLYYDNTSATISLGAGTGPLGALYSDGAVWISCHLTNQVKRIVGTTVTHTIAVGTRPCLLFGYGGNIYVCNYNSDSVSVINATTMLVTGTINVGDGPFGLAEAGGFLWVANYASSTLSKINLATGTVVATLALGHQTGPTDIAYDGDSRIWVSEAQARQVTGININTHEATAHIPTPASPRTVVFDGINLFTPNNTNGSSGTLSVTLTNPAPGGGTSAPADFAIIGVDLSPLPT